MLGAPGHLSQHSQPLLWPRFLPRLGTQPYPQGQLSGRSHRPTDRGGAGEETSRKVTSPGCRSSTFIHCKPRHTHAAPAVYKAVTGPEGKDMNKSEKHPLVFIHATRSTEGTHPRSLAAFVWEAQAQPDRRADWCRASAGTPAEVVPSK